MPILQAGTNTRQIDEIKKKMTDKLTKYNLKINPGKTERYQIPRPKTPPPPTTTLKELLQHKMDRINYSDLDWLVTYKPPSPENKEPDMA